MGGVGSWRGGRQEGSREEGVLAVPLRPLTNVPLTPWPPRRPDPETDAPPPERSWAGRRPPPTGSEGPPAAGRPGRVLGRPVAPLPPALWGLVRTGGDARRA